MGNKDTHRKHRQRQRQTAEKNIDELLTLAHQARTMINRADLPLTPQSFKEAKVARDILGRIIQDSKTRDEFPLKEVESG